MIIRRQSRSLTTMPFGAKEKTMTTENDENDVSKQESKSRYYAQRMRQYKEIAADTVALAKQMQRYSRDFVELDEHQALTLASHAIAAMRIAELEKPLYAIAHSIAQRG